MSTRLHLFAICFALLILIAGGYFALPQLWASAVPGYLEEKIGPVLGIQEATLLRSPPRLVLKNVLLRNPHKFGGGEAIHIGEITVTFQDYKRDPMRIKAIDVRHVRGRLVMQGTDSNFSEIFSVLMDVKGDKPEGQMANRATLETVSVTDISIIPPDGSVEMPIANTDFKPKGPLKDGTSVQHVVTDVLAAITRQQSEAAPALLVKGAVNDAATTLRDVGQSVEKAINNYLQKK